MLVSGTPWSAREAYLRSLVGQSVELSGTITEDPDTSSTRTTFRLSGLSLGEAAIPGVIFVSGSADRSLRRGDYLTLRGKLSAGFGVFAGTLYRPEVVARSRPQADLLLDLRDLFSSHLRALLPEQEAALGLGYLLGVRSSLPQHLDQTLRVVGLTHIIVASGANLSILIGFARRLFARCSRRLALYLSAGLVLVYVGMVGLSPSMLRAGLVSLLSLLAWFVGREFAAWRLLLLVAAATLLYNPMFLLDLGWLLSFASFAGVMILAPQLTRFFYGSATPGLLGATLIETISASLLCAPILLYFFGSLSLISLFANLLILPTISLAMALCFGAGLFSLLALAPLASCLAWLASLLLSYHLAVIDFFGAQTAFLFTCSPGNGAVFGLYLLLLPFLIKSIRKTLAKTSSAVYNKRVLHS